MIMHILMAPITGTKINNGICIKKDYKVNTRIYEYLGLQNLE